MKDYSPKQWSERIRDGQRYQMKLAESKRWEVYKNYYRHKFAPGIIPVNMMFSILRSMVPQVYFKNPAVSITSRRPGLEYELNARIVQEIDNWLLRELMTKSEIKRLISDNFFSGIASGFVGYDSMYGYSPENMENQQYGLSQFDKKGYRIEYNSNVNPGMPWFLRARPDDVIWPWGCESATNAEWVALRVFRPVLDLRKDPKYQVPQDLKGTFRPIRTDPDGASRVEDHVETDPSISQDWVELFQVHDARTGKILAITHDQNTFLRNEVDELQIDGLPVETICFNPDPDFIYGVPDARIIEPQLLELNEIRTQAMKHRRLDIVKFLYKKNAINKEELQKMTSEVVGAGIEANVDSALRDAVITFNSNVSGILQDLAMSGELVRGDVRETVGFSRTAQGEFQGKTHISAEETKRVFQSLNIRLDERRDMVADLLVRIVRKFNQLIFTNWDSERVQQVIGPDGAKWWLKYTGQQIKDEYNIAIAPEEGPDLDSQTKFNMAVTAAETWSKMNQGAIAAGMPVPMEIQRLLFSQFRSSGLDVDRLSAQTEAMFNQMKQAQQGQQGSSPESAVSPGMAAAMLQGGR